MSTYPEYPRATTVRLGLLVALVVGVAAGVGVWRHVQAARQWAYEPPVHPAAVAMPRAKHLRWLGCRSWSYEAGAEATAVAEFYAAALVSEGWEPVPAALPAGVSNYRYGPYLLQVHLAAHHQTTAVGLLLTQTSSDRYDRAGRTRGALPPERP